MSFARHNFFSRYCITPLVMLALLGGAFAPLGAHAQVQSVQLSDPNVLGDAFQGAVDSTFQQIETGVTGAVEGVGAGSNPIVAGAAAGAAGAVGSAVGCVVSGALFTAANAITAVPVADRVTNLNTSADTSRECLQDGIVFALKEGIIKGILQGMVTYINNGFSGGPGYLRDEEQYLNSLQDRQFDQYLNNPNNFTSLCSAWEADLRLALASEYTTASAGERPGQLSNTGTGLSSPVAGSGTDTCEILSEGYADGDGGGNFWEQFQAQTTNSDGNPVTSYFNIREQFQENLEYNIEKELREIQRNEGFFDVTYCDDGSAGYQELPGEVISTGEQECKVTTPGSVINEQLNSALDSDLRRLELADEINEVFSALIGQLIKMVFSELGLFGTTQRTGGSQSLIDEYANTDANTASSRAQLLNQLQNYEDAAIEYIDLKEQSASALLDARQAVFDALACYESKYNTWGIKAQFGTPQYVIDPSNIDSIPESDRERVTFQRRSTIGGATASSTIFLTPDTSLEQLDGYAQILDNINSYIVSIRDDVLRAEVNIDQARLYKAQMGYIDESNDPVDAALASSTVVELISDTYGSGGNTVSVSLDDGTIVEIPQNLSAANLLEVYNAAMQSLDMLDNQAANLQTSGVERATEELLQGVPLQTGGRAPGILEDINQCRAFTTVHNPIDSDS